MGNQFNQLLNAWYPRRHAANWVLGTLYRTEGSTYRKAGAMMLVNDQGEQFGLLSGGCLEDDIKRRAAEVWKTSRPDTLVYDSSKEDDIAFELGIGCGGVVHILLQPVTEADHFLSLVEVHDALLKRQTGLYFQRIPQADQGSATRFEPGDINRTRRAELIELEGAQWLVTPAYPPIHLLIAGAGLDAQPLAALAHDLGWQITLWDPRVKPDQRNNFPHCDQFISTPADRLNVLVQEGLDAAVLMTHNTALDAVALSRLHNRGLGYLAMIGPRHRRAEVLKEASLSEDTLGMPLAGPAGLDLGTTLPETIALSILAECQAVLNNTDARSLSGRLKHD